MDGADSGRIYVATSACLASFHSIADESHDHDDISTRLADCLARFRIWAGNLGAWHPRTDRSSADHRLRDAPEVEDRLVELLEELTETNGHVKAILTGSAQDRKVLNDDDSEDDGDSSDGAYDGTSELSELVLSLGDLVTSLMKVSMLVRKATTRDRYVRATQAGGQPFLPDFDIRHVCDKFPRVRSQSWLYERLGAAITQRRQFLRYSREHKARLAHEPLASAPVHQVPPANLVVPENPALPAPRYTVAPTASTRPTLTPTAASTLQADRVAREDLQDLDRDDDAVSQATSFMSSHADGATAEGLHVVQLSTLRKYDDPFECVYCHAIVHAKRQRSFKRHVLADLRAYVCTFEHCKSGLFEDRDAWWQHEMDVHRRQWVCQSCPDKVFETATGLQSHLRSVHDGTALPAELLAQIAAASSTPVTEIAASECPLCDQIDTIVRQEAARMHTPIPENHRVKIPLKKFQQHLGYHLEQLALFAVPPQIDGNIESGSRHSREGLAEDYQHEVCMAVLGRTSQSYRYESMLILAQKLLTWQDKLLPDEGSINDEDIYTPDTIENNGRHSTFSPFQTSNLSEQEPAAAAIHDENDLLKPCLSHAHAGGQESALVDSVDANTTDKHAGLSVKSSITRAVLANDGTATVEALIRAVNPTFDVQIDRTIAPPQLSILRGIASLVHVAIQLDCQDAFVPLIADRRVDVNTRDGRGYNALQCASTSNRVFYTESLLQHRGHHIDVNAVVDMQDFNRKPQWQTSNRFGRLNSPTFDRPSNESIETSHERAVDGQTALSIATESGRLEIMNVLLRHGADPNSSGSLLTAVLAQRTQAATLLIEHGADVNVKCEFYASPLAAAASRGNVDLMRVLLDNGADIDAVGSVTDDIVYGTPLVTAVMRASTEAVALLIRRGADVRLSGPRGDPLTIARAEQAANPSTAEVYRSIVNMLEDRLEEMKASEAPPRRSAVVGQALDAQNDTQATTKDFRPGDVVYVPQQSHNSLRYVRAVFLNELNDSRCNVRDWLTSEIFETDRASLVRKAQMNAQELAAAETLRAQSAGDKAHRPDDVREDLVTHSNEAEEASRWPLAVEFAGVLLPDDAGTALAQKFEDLLEQHRLKPPTVFSRSFASFGQRTRALLAAMSGRDRSLGNGIHVLYTAIAATIQSDFDAGWSSEPLPTQQLEDKVRMNAEPALALLEDELLRQGWGVTHGDIIDRLRRERNLVRNADIDADETAATEEPQHTRLRQSFLDVKTDHDRLVVHRDFTEGDMRWPLAEQLRDVVISETVFNELEKEFVERVLSTSGRSAGTFSRYVESFLQQIRALWGVLDENDRSLGRVLHVLYTAIADAVQDGVSTHYRFARRTDPAFQKTVEDNAAPALALFEKVLLRHSWETTAQDVIAHLQQARGMRYQPPLSLSKAVVLKDADGLRALVATASRGDLQSPDSDRALALAIETHQLDLMQILLVSVESGANRMVEGDHILGHALRKQDAEIARHLLDHGANVSTMIRQSHRLPSIAHSLDLYCDREPTLGKDLFMDLLNHSDEALVRDVDFAGRNLLHYSVPRPLPHLARHLLEHGAIVDAHDATGQTAMQLLLDKEPTDERLDVFARLLEYNARMSGAGYTTSREERLRWYLEQTEAGGLVTSGHERASTADEARTSTDALDTVFMPPKDSDEASDGEESDTASSANNDGREGVGAENLDSIFKSLLGSASQNQTSATPLDQVARVKDQDPVQTSTSKRFADGFDEEWFAAAKTSAVVRIETLLREGFDVNATDQMTYTAMHHAAAQGYTDIMAILLQAGADIGAKTALGDTPLHLAASTAQLPAVQHLLDAGASVNVKNVARHTPLFLALQHLLPGTRLVVETLLKNGASTRLTKDLNVSHALMEARAAEDISPMLVLVAADLLTLLLDHDSELVALTDSVGRTPLHTSVVNLQQVMAERLLVRGADVNAADASGATPMMLLCALPPLSEVRRAAMFRLLVEYGSDYDPDLLTADTEHIFGSLSDHTQSNPVIVVDSLSNVPSAAVTAVNNDVLADTESGFPKSAAFPGKTGSLLQPTVQAADIFAAIDEGDWLKLKKLLDMGGDPDAFNAATEPALHRAAERPDVKILQVLLNGRANINIRNAQGQTALHRAVQYDRHNTAECLLKFGAEHSPLDRLGQTPLLFAAGQNAPSVEIMELLFCAGATLQTLLKQSRTVLHLVLDKAEGPEPFGVVQWIVETDDLLVNMATQHRRQTPLHMAVDNIWSRCADLLITHGAKVSVMNAMGQTPMDLLLQNERTASLETFQLLYQHGGALGATAIARLSEHCRQNYHAYLEALDHLPQVLELATGTSEPNYEPELATSDDDSDQHDVDGQIHPRSNTLSVSASSASKLDQRIETKQRRIRKHVDNVQRWVKQPIGYRASTEKALEEIKALTNEIEVLKTEKKRREEAIGGLAQFKSEDPPVLARQAEVVERVTGSNAQSAKPGSDHGSAPLDGGEADSPYQHDNNGVPAKRFPSSKDVDMEILLKQMQEPPPHGITFRDRRWLSRLHLQCFHGEELTSWLLRAFEDLSDRESATALGGGLLQRGGIVHVQGWQVFRDGNYLYQIADPYRVSKGAGPSTEDGVLNIELPDEGAPLEGPSTIASLEDAAAREEGDSDWAQAAGTISQIVRWRKRVLGPMNASTLDDLRRLYRVYVMQSDWAAAEELWREAVGIALVELDPEDPRTLDCQSELGAVLIHQSRLAEARALLEPLLDAYMRTRGPYHTDTVRVMYQLAGAYTDLDMLGEATALYEQALHARQQTLQDYHTETLYAMYWLACSYNRLGRYADSARTLEIELSLRREHFGAGDLETIRAQKELGRTYRLTGRLEESAGMLSDVLSRYNKLLGDGHPLTAEAAQEMATTMEAQGDLGSSASALKILFPMQDETMEEKQPASYGKRPASPQRPSDTASTSQLRLSEVTSLSGASIPMAGADAPRATENYNGATTQEHRSSQKRRADEPPVENVEADASKTVRTAQFRSQGSSTTQRPDRASEAGVTPPLPSHGLASASSASTVGHDIVWHNSVDWDRAPRSAIQRAVLDMTRDLESEIASEQEDAIPAPPSDPAPASKERQWGSRMPRDPGNG